MYILLLTLFIAIIIYSAVTGGRSYKVLEASTNTQERQGIFRSWIRESWLLFGVPSLAVIFLLLQLDQSLAIKFNNSVLESVGFGVSVGVIAILLIVVVHSWRQAVVISQAERKKVKKLISESGSGGLIAKNHHERILATQLSIAAGITEELFFRVALPLLMIAVFGIDWIVPIIIASTVLFGAAHAYQGILGVISTAIIGAIFIFMYVSTGSILIVIILHILMDVRATVALSWLAYGRGK